MDEDTKQQKTSDVVMSSNIGIPVVHQVKDCVSLFLQTIPLRVTGLCLCEGLQLS